jgi:hypothetical protein
MRCNGGGIAALVIAPARVGRSEGAHASQRSRHPAYRGGCAGAHDCRGGSGNGPNRVVGYDEFRPSAERDGLGWELSAEPWG